MTKPAFIDLINAALVTIGQEPIVSLDDTSTVSSIVTSVKAKAELCKRELLRSNDWNCARKTAKLAIIPGAVTQGWQYVYQLPTNPECLRVVQISLDSGQNYVDLDEYYNTNAGPKEALFDIDGHQLLCNSPKVYIKYTADVDAALFDAGLAQAFVYQLAAELSYSLPASVSLAEFMVKIYRQKLKAAKSQNARERNILRPEGDVIGIRYGTGDKTLRVDMSDQMEE